MRRIVRSKFTAVLTSLLAVAILVAALGVGEYAGRAHAAAPLPPCHSAHQKGCTPPPSVPTQCADSYTHYQVREDGPWEVQYETSTASDWWIEAELQQLYDTWYGTWCAGMIVYAIGEIDEAAIPGVGYVCLADNTSAIAAAQLKNSGVAPVNGTFALDVCNQQTYVAETLAYYQSGCFYGWVIWNGTSLSARTNGTYCQ